jgi:mycofactocin precursor
VEVPVVPAAVSDVAPESEADEDSDAALVEDDLLIEDVSIDGMCGVY